MRREAFPDVGKWLPYLGAGPVVGVLGTALYAWSLHDFRLVFAVALLIAGAAFLVGGLLGFLFGIPRSLSTEAAVERPPATDGAAETDAAARSATYRSNTNLEQISDWLTKILVGVGLVQLGTLVRETGKLVDFLSPALGDEPSTPSFALAVLLLYTISGFLIVYLLTRVYLGRVFAHADELMRYVDDRVGAVEESQRAQQARDVEALARVGRQLEPEGTAPPATQEELNDAVAAASPIVRQQIFNRARERRRQGTPEQKARTIPVFRALVAADEEGRFHRNHAQLAYALKDQAEPDFAAAVAELDRAIEIRDSLGEDGFLIYEFNRAVCRIETDPRQPAGEPSDPDLREQILSDLRKAAASPFLRRKMAETPAIASWLERNGLAVADVAPGPGEGE
jgi:hypothetical protein